LPDLLELLAGNYLEFPADRLLDIMGIGQPGIYPANAFEDLDNWFNDQWADDVKYANVQHESRTRKRDVQFVNGQCVSIIYLLLW